MLRITEIKGEDIYFNNGKVLWILYFQGLSALGRAPKLPTSDLIKVGKAMGDIGYSLELPPLGLPIRIYFISSNILIYGTLSLLSLILTLSSDAAMLLLF